MSDSREQFGQMLAERAVHYQGMPSSMPEGGFSNWYVDLRVGLADGQQASHYILEDTLEVPYTHVAGIGTDGQALVTGVLLANRERSYRRRLVGLWGDDGASESSVDPAIPNTGNRSPFRLDPESGYGVSPRHIADESVLAVDGTFTTGEPLVTLVSMLRKSGAIVHTAAVLVDGGNGALAEVARHLGVTLHRLFEFQESSGQLTVAPGPFGPDGQLL